MMHVTLLLFAGIAAALLGGFIALNILAWRHAFALLHYADESSVTRSSDLLSRREKAALLLEGIRVPRPAGTSTPADIGLFYESIRIPTPSGVSLGAWLCPADRSGAPLVLLFHGYAQDKSSMLREAEAFHGMGFACLVVDFRGSGESSASHTTIGVQESDDVAAAFRYARARFPGRPPILFGHSMGAAAILRAIQQEADVRPAALVLESVFDSMYQTAINRFTLHNMPAFLNVRLLLFWGGRQFGFNAFTHNPADYARSVTCPSLFFQGSSDDKARPQDARRVFEAIASPHKLFCQFSDHGHASCLSRHSAAWLAATRSFFEIHDLVA